MSESMTKSRIIAATAVMMKSRITAHMASDRATARAADVITAKLSGAEFGAGLTASLTGLTITAAMNTAARASLIISVAMKSNIASLTTGAVTGAALKSEDFS